MSENIIGFLFISIVTLLLASPYLILLGKLARMSREDEINKESSVKVVEELKTFEDEEIKKLMKKYDNIDRRNRISRDCPPEWFAGRLDEWREFWDSSHK